MSFLRRLFRVTTLDYELKALVSSRTLEPLTKFDGAVQLFCDLDKTYLETEFESWIKMAKIPFESPHDKITVPGASEVLELVRWGNDPRAGQSPVAGLHFVSSSPPQLRLALDGKLTLDHLEWSSDTFKNQSYNLRMARIDLLRHHIAYKTKAILDIATKLPENSRVIMVGDNAEFDAFIYTGVRLFLERRIGVSGLKDWLRGAKVEDAVIAQVIGAEVKVPADIKVEGIFIRNVPGYNSNVVSRFEDTWYRFDHWAQVAWSFMKTGVISPVALPRVIRAFHNLHGVPLAHLRWCIYKALANENVGSELKKSAEDTLGALGVVGASGPSRRMLPWEFDLEVSRDIDLVGEFDAKTDAGQWYHSVEGARQERKRRRGK